MGFEQSSPKTYFLIKQKMKKYNRFLMPFFAFIIVLATVGYATATSFSVPVSMHSASPITIVDEDGFSINATNPLEILDKGDRFSLAQGQDGAIVVHKFGNSPDFDTADGEVSVWGGSNDGGIDEMTYVYSATAIIDSISSTNAGDTQNVEVQGLDSLYALTTQTVTLTGQTRVPLSTDLIRVFRVQNMGTTDFAGTVTVYEDTTLSAGIPTDTTKIRAIVNGADNQTLMAIYTIPAGYTGYMNDFNASTAGANKTSNYVIKLKIRPFESVFKVKNIEALDDSGTSFFRYEYQEPKVFAEKTDIEMTAQMKATSGTGASVSTGFDIVLLPN